ncbi:MAG: hypothetical protein IKG22_16330, partial [Atopobiaceae bacterium]|nr:hypothetical protein [Atopobiaceae bacterium]
LMAMRGPTGEPYRPTYLHTVSNQLSALLNHAVLHYNLPSNPARKVPKMGSKDAGEMSIWTKAQYLRFSRAIMDKPDSWMAFELNLNSAGGHPLHGGPARVGGDGDGVDCPSRPRRRAGREPGEEARRALAGAPRGGHTLLDAALGDRQDHLPRAHRRSAIR